jgi:agmatinase
VRRVSSGTRRIGFINGFAKRSRRQRFGNSAVPSSTSCGHVKVVLLDAHLDYRDKSMDIRFTNNSPFRRVHELPFIQRIVTVGVRGIKSTDREYRESLGHGNLIFPADRVHDAGIGTIVTEIGNLGNYYVSLDIDALDPSVAPGTESPEADGLTFRQAKQLLRGISSFGKLVGVDIVEVNPYLDHAELTQHISVQLLLEAIASGFPTPPAVSPK